MYALTAAYVRSMLLYDPRTGIFRHKYPRFRVRAGEVAGSPNEWGHIRIKLDGKLYMAHRLAWIYMTGEEPPCQIDHRDTNPANNAWLNLRLATGSQNMCNIGMRKDNKTGFKGVSWHPKKRRFSAGIRYQGRKRHLGYFDDPSEAYELYCLAADMLHGEFANHGI